MGEGLLQLGISSAALQWDEWKMFRTEDRKDQTATESLWSFELNWLTTHDTTFGTVKRACVKADKNTRTHNRFTGFWNVCM